MKRDELISVVVPVFNVERYIDNCMASLANQSDKNYEVVIINDGSTDSSIDIVERYASKIEHLRIYCQPNRGLGAARNIGIDQALGDFIVFIDSDDFVSENFIESLRLVQRSGNYDIVTGGFLRVEEASDILSYKPVSDAPQISIDIKYYQKVLGAFAPSIACARLYRKSFLRSIGIRFPDRVPYEDLFFTYKALYHCERHAFVGDRIYFWRQRQGSLSKSVTHEHLNAGILLWADTLKYLYNVGAGPLDEALAARRNLTLFETIRRLTEYADVNIHEMLVNTISTNRDIFLSMLDKMKNSRIKDAYISPRLMDLLSECQAVPGRSVFSLTNNRRANICSQGASRPLGTAMEFVVNRLPLSLKVKLSHRFPRLHRAIRSLQGKEAEPVEPPVSKRTTQINIDLMVFPLRGYHLDDCLPVVHRLRELGYSVEIINTDSVRSTWEVTSRAASRGIKLLDFHDFVSSRSKVRCVVLFNDWDPLMRLVARISFDNQITTIGWVEGIQDYLDADTGRLRYPYRRSLHVILPGLFDKRYFKENGQILHIGQIVRIQELWKNRLLETNWQEKNVLINSNFSYGVLDNRRDVWLGSAVEACLESKVDPIISRHPFDTGTLYKEFETKATFLDALKVSAVSIHRFASGILESLAYGKPVIYYNPHRETVDKFLDPRGAYLIANSKEELVEILRNRRFYWDERAVREFLELHAGLITNGSDPATVMTQIIESIIQDSLPPNDALSKGLLKTDVLTSPGGLRKAEEQIGPIFGVEHMEKVR